MNANDCLIPPKWAWGLIAVAAIAISSQPLQAAIATVDLTTAGASHTVVADHGGTFIVTQGSVQPTGTGTFSSFVRIQQSGGENGEQGYNTSNTRYFDEKTDPNYTRAILLNEVPVVSIDGVDYREFVLDINENNGPGNLLSLNQIQLFVGPTDPENYAGLTPVTETTPSRISFDDRFTEIFRMNDVTEDFTQIKLNYSQASGSGESDMFLYVRNDQFGAGNPNVILYSQFGYPPRPPVDASDAGFEEWAVRPGGGPENPEPGDSDNPGPDGSNQVPEPATLAIWTLGLGIAGLVRLRRQRV